MTRKHPVGLMGRIDFWAHYVRQVLHLPTWIIEPVCFLYDWRLGVYKSQIPEEGTE